MSKLTKEELARLVHLLPEMELRRNYALDFARRRNPANAAELDELIFLLRKLGIYAHINPKANTQVLELPDSLLRDVTECAAKHGISRHDTYLMLLKSGLAAQQLAESVGMYRQLAKEVLEGEIANALAPLKQRRGDEGRGAIT